MTTVSKISTVSDNSFLHELPSTVTGPYNSPEINEVAKPVKKPDNTYYQSSIASLATDTSTATTTTIETKKKSFWGDWFSTIYNWFNVSVLGKSPSVNETDTTSVNGTSPLSTTPQLAEPYRSSRDKHAEHVLELQRRLAKDLENLRSDEDDLQNMSTRSFDAFLQKAFLSAFMQQTDLKRQMSTDEGKSMLEIHSEKRELHKKQFAIEDDLVSKTKTSKYLHWVNVATNIGITIGIIGLTVMSMLNPPAGGILAGAFNGLMTGLGITQPVLFIAKGVNSGGQVYINYQTEKLSSKMFSITQESKKMDNIISEKSTNLQDLEEEIAQMLKTVRQLLENHNEATRAFTGNN